MALAVSKYVEIKTKQSIQAFLSECKKITDTRILIKLSNKIILACSFIRRGLKTSTKANSSAALIWTSRETYAFVKSY